MSFDEQAYKNKYDKDTYARKNFRLKKYEMKELEEFVKANSDLSFNKFMHQALLEKKKRIIQSNFEKGNSYGNISYDYDEFIDDLEYYINEKYIDFDSLIAIKRKEDGTRLYNPIIDIKILSENLDEGYIIKNVNDILTEMKKMNKIF